MTASPGRTAQNSRKHMQEVQYVERLREMPVDELLGKLSIDSALEIDANSEKPQLFEEILEDNGNELKFNTAIYSDDAEDFIFNDALAKLIEISRSAGDHSAAEHVRILRSARAVIFFALKDRSS